MRTSRKAVHDVLSVFGETATDRICTARQRAKLTTGNVYSFSGASIAPRNYLYLININDYFRWTPWPANSAWLLPAGMTNLKIHCNFAKRSNVFQQGADLAGMRPTTLWFIGLAGTRCSWCTSARKIRSTERRLQEHPRNDGLRRCTGLPPLPRRVCACKSKPPCKTKGRVNFLLRRAYCQALVRARLLKTSVLRLTLHIVSRHERCGAVDEAGRTMT